MTNTTPIQELEAALPVIIEREKNGLIRPDTTRLARDLVDWSKRRPLSEKQQLLVGKLLARVGRKYKANANITIGKDVDVPAIVNAVIEKLGAEKMGAENIELITEAVLGKVD